MRKTGRYYCSIVSANLMALLVGCSYHSKNNRMDTPPLEEQSVVAQASTSKPYEFSDVLKKVNTLLETFKQCCAYIDTHRGDYTLNSIARTDGAFHSKQQDRGGQKCYSLMQYNEMNAIDYTRVSQDNRITLKNFETSPKLKNLETFSHTFYALCYLKFWNEAASKRLKDLCDDSCMKPENFTNTVNSLVQFAIDKISQTQISTAKDKNVPDHFCNCTNKQQGYNYVSSYKDTAEVFLYGVSDFLYLDLLSYWGKIVELFIFHALNTSVVQGKIRTKEAKERYQTVCNTVKRMYSAEYSQALVKCFRTESKNIIEYGPYENRYSFIKIINKLIKSSLKPIQDMYANLSELINEIEYSDDSSLKDNVIGSLTMFYNIAYSLGIIDLISTFSNIVSFYFARNHLKKEELVEVIGREDVQLVITQVYLANFIQGNETGFDQVNSKVKELIDDVNNLLNQNKNNNSCHVRSNVGKA
ncbi:hypothetical protein [Cardinium endosymbiont of Philonthus spinipes]|uniref:hypothetical protein n=1 Tax=Cardinium endosymbiont of Philonthus spinipes TaxID=3077941 RepID=UPI00313D3792